MLDSTASAPQIAVVARSGCKHCLKAKTLLKTEGYPYTEVDVTDNIGLLSLIREVTDHRTVPQIFINGNFIGGADVLVAKFEDGTLKTLLESESKPGLPQDLEQRIAAFKEQQAQEAKQAPVVDEGPQVPADLLALAERLKTLKSTERSTKRFTYTRAFNGADLVVWLQGNKGGDNVAALEVGKQLLQYGLIYPIKDDCKSFLFFKTSCNSMASSSQVIRNSSEEWYSLKGSTVKPKAKGVALNTHYSWNQPVRPAIQVSTRLRLLISSLYDQFLSKDGKAVSYKGIGASPLFNEYVDATAELQHVNLSDLSREELLCFFINLYNAIIIHATVVFGAPESTLARAAFFTKLAVYNVAGNDYTADDMEHGVLRGNKAPSSSLGNLLGIPALAFPQFKSSDPRAMKVVTPMDPRIHFALVCGAKSCPPISLYEPDSLEEGLQGAAEAFCSSEVVVDKASRTVKASMILKWYGVDFGRNSIEILQALVPFMSGQGKKDLKALLADAASGSKDIKLEFMPYDWSVNTADKE